MTGSSAPAPCATPSPGVSYPLKIGKSLRARRGARATPARDLLAVRFTHVPESAALNLPGSICRNDDKCTVQLPTQDGSAVQFNGHRRSHMANVNDYVLIFANGCMWLERTSDMFYGMRPVNMSDDRPPPNIPHPGHDDVRADPDSWMSGADDESGSPITPESNGADSMEDPDPAPPSRVAGKSTPGSTERKLVSGFRSSKPAEMMRTTAPVASKSVAGKSVAGKGPSNTNGSVGRRRPDDDDDNSDGNDGSSSDEDDSDSEDSDSDSDSQEYTDRSSDEE